MVFKNKIQACHNLEEPGTQHYHADNVDKEGMVKKKEVRPQPTG